MIESNIRWSWFNTEKHGRIKIWILVKDYFRRDGNTDTIGFNIGRKVTYRLRKQKVGNHRIVSPMEVA